MDGGRLQYPTSAARKVATGRWRRAAQFSAARQLARTRPSDDPAHSSSSRSDSSSGSSSPSVGLSDAADDEAEEEGPRSAASGGQRRGTKQSRTGASPRCEPRIQAEIERHDPAAAQRHHLLQARRLSVEEPLHHVGGGVSITWASSRAYCGAAGRRGRRAAQRRARHAQRRFGLRRAQWRQRSGHHPFLQQVGAADVSAALPHRRGRPLQRQDALCPADHHGQASHPFPIRVPHVLPVRAVDPAGQTGTGVGP